MIKSIIVWLGFWFFLWMFMPAEVGFQQNNHTILPVKKLVQVEETMESLICDPVEDSLTLVNLYNSTGGSTTWVNTDNWLVPGQPIDTWYGIQTNGDGCVTCIDLDGFPDCENILNQEMD